MKYLPLLPRYKIQKFNPPRDKFECFIAKIVYRVLNVLMPYFHYYLLFCHLHSQHQPASREESKANFRFLQNFEIATIYGLPATHSTTDFQPGTYRKPLNVNTGLSSKSFDRLLTGKYKNSYAFLNGSSDAINNICEVFSKMTFRFFRLFLLLLIFSAVFASVPGWSENVILDQLECFSLLPWFIFR